MGPNRFGGAATGFVHPVIAIAVLIACVLILTVPRRRILAPLLGAAILVPMDQVLVIGGLHFQMIRVLILVGWIRVLMSGRGPADPTSPRPRWNPIDTALVICVVLGAIDIILLWQSTAAAQNQLGTVYMDLGLYFLLRALVQSEADILYGIRILAWISAFVAVVMIIEQVTRTNPYVYIWANASPDTSVMERDGKFRAMACFAHPLLAGTFGAICFPLFLALWHKDSKARRLSIIGMCSSVAIVWAANSSTPLLALVASILATFLWPIRRSMRILRWGIVITLISLHLSMKAPVWALIGRVDVTGSSSSYHRYQLVDQFIRHFSDWWLFGTKDNASWGWDMWDLANQYVAVGETSGLFPFIAFVAIIVYGFKMLGNACRRAAGRVSERFLWTLGIAMFANVVAFFGISYHDQTIAVWYLFLAMIPVASSRPRSVHDASTAVHKSRQLDTTPALV